jgi:hypothetical protein
VTLEAARANREEVEISGVEAGVAAGSHGEWDRREKSGRRNRNLLLIAVVLEVRVGNLPSRCEQGGRIARTGKRAEHGVRSAEYYAAHADSDGQGKDGDGSEPRRARQHARGVDHVLPDLGEILGGQVDGNIGQQPHQAKQTVPPPGFRSGVLTQAVQIFSVDYAEFVGIGVRQMPVEG